MSRFPSFKNKIQVLNQLVESFDVSSIKNKKEWKKYKSGIDTNELKVEFGVFKVGSDLTLGNPSNKEISLDFKLVTVNKFSIMGSMAAVPSLGEFINPNAPLNRQQAIAKLKEAKDLLELDMMSKEEFDALKAELSPIIRGN